MSEIQVVHASPGLKCPDRIDFRGSLGDLLPIDGRSDFPYYTDGYAVVCSKPLEDACYKNHHRKIDSRELVDFLRGVTIPATFEAFFVDADVYHNKESFRFRRVSQHPIAHKKQEHDDTWPRVLFSCPARPAGQDFDGPAYLQYNQRKFNAIVGRRDLTTLDFGIGKLGVLIIREKTVWEIGALMPRRWSKNSLGVPGITGAFSPVPPNVFLDPASHV